jgi:hypothetical protein
VWHLLNGLSINKQEMSESLGVGLDGEIALPKGQKVKRGEKT